MSSQSVPFTIRPGVAHRLQLQVTTPLAADELQVAHTRDRTKHPRKC
jgi:hypothetical protein